MHLPLPRFFVALMLALSLPAISSASSPLPADRAAIQAAIDAAKPGDTLTIAAGTVEGSLTIDKKLTLTGAGKDATMFHAATGKALTIGATVTLENLTVSGKSTEKVTAIYQRKNSDLTVRGCRIADAREDGIGYDADFNSVTRVFNSEVTGCGDGIDVESTQAIILNTRFEKNSDDGLDLDGDAGVTVMNCVFIGNRDDGIEVRLARAAHLLAVGNTFENNGEDGIELIDSPVRITNRRETNNLITVMGNTFRGNKRFGVGGVSVVTEEAADTMVQCALFGSGNKFEASGKASLSKNLWPVDLSQDRSQQTVEVGMTSPNGTTRTKLPVRPLYPVAVYNLHPSAAGVSLRDGEGLTIGDDGTFALLADDDTPAIWRLDLRTAEITRVFAPVKGGSIKGPEGLTRGSLPGEYLMSDDDGAQVLTLAFGADGKLIEKKREPVKAIFDYPEGIEMVGESLAFAGNSQLLLVDAATRKPRTGFPVKYSLKPFGSHIGGVGYDGTRLWLTAAGYTKASQQNDRSLLLAADAASGTVREAYSLGEYTSDPRSVSARDGFIYVIDGYASPTLPGGTEPNRLGVKVFVFALTPPADPMALLPHLPLRRK